MKVLIVGGGGREHALAWKCAQSPRVRAGVRRARQRRHGARAEGAATSTSPPTTSTRCSTSPSREDIALTIVGPEGPLVAGIVDRFTAAQAAPASGRRSAAARLEGSKAFTKDFLQRHRIPTASYAAFTAADFDPAYMRAQRLPLVVKADGLAAGKGVVICETHESAIDDRAAPCSGAASAPPATPS